MDFLKFKTDSIHELCEAILAEEWTPERKAEMEKTFKDRGFVLVGHEVVGEYDLTLWRCEADGPIKGVHSVAINSGQIDPGDVSTHDQKYPVGKYNRGHLEAVLPVLQDWIKQCGRLLIASVSYRKISRYRSLLARYFLISNYDERYPDNLFYISEK